MRLLMIVGSANSIFVYNMAKWLKKSMDINIDIFEFYPPDSKDFDNRYYDRVESVNRNIWFNKIRFVRSLMYPYYASAILKSYIKNRFYDVIHCHWIVPPLVLTKNIKRSCKALFITFWGGEMLNKLSILRSKSLYNRHLKIFLNNGVDYIVNSTISKVNLYNKYPDLKCKHIEGNFGSSSIELIYSVMESESKNFSKLKLNIDPTKITVMIGYSGKLLHQHLPIIMELTKRGELKSKLHLISPMTRDAIKHYCDQVEEALQKSGYSYTILRDKFLSDEEIAHLRNATDITLQLSTFDGFSRSIVECLCAKSILIYGDWIKYEDYLKENNFSAHPVSSISEGIDQLCLIAEKIETYKDEIEKNSSNGKNKYLWSECIKAWVDAYKIVCK